MYNDACRQARAHNPYFPTAIFHKLTTTNHNFEIEERRRRVASFVARGNMTQTEMAQQLGVDQSTISDDIKALKEMSQRFIFDLAKSDLAYYYKQAIDGIEEAKAQAWDIYSKAEEEDLSVKDKLAALRLTIDANVEKFKLINDGPAVLAMKSLEERLRRIETTQSTVSGGA
jgi:Trp operon repressor